MGTAFLYGNGGSGGTGATLTVSAPAGCTVTVSKDGKTKTKTAGEDGVVVFKGLETGDWTLSITDGEQTAQKTVTITTDYSAAITFFAATIHVTYPAGSTCTATDGVTTLTAPDTSGSWACVVPNAGTWTVKITDGSGCSASETVEITTKGQSVSVELSYGWFIKNGVLSNGFSVTSMQFYGESGNTPEPTQGDGYIGWSSDASQGFLIDPNIDLTPYNTLNIDMELNMSGGSKWFAVGVGSDVYWHDRGSEMSPKYRTDDSFNRRVIKLDVSAINSKQYIKFVSYAQGSGDLKVYNVWGDIA